MQRALFFAVFCLVCSPVLSGCDGGETSPIAVNPPRAGDTLHDDKSNAPSADVVGVRLIPFRTSSGARTKMVLVDWKNTGATVVRAVDADIVPYDERGNRLEDGAKDYAIYAVSDSSPGIAPGESYTEPNGKGYILAPFFGEAARAEVRITEVVESGAFGDMLSEAYLSTEAREEQERQRAITKAESEELMRQQFAIAHHFRTVAGAG